MQSLSRAGRRTRPCSAVHAGRQQTSALSTTPGLAYKPASRPPTSRLPARGSAAIPGVNLRDKLETKQNAQGRQRTYDVFRRLALHRAELYFTGAGSWSSKKAEYKGFGLEKQGDFDREARLFKASIDKACDLASQQDAVSRSDNPIFWSLRNAFVEGDNYGLSREITYAFQNFLMRSRFSRSITATHKKLADFRFPYEWFPATRTLQRTIHLHVGPTNSGKTYNALKALENAESGIYAGPLRLLAHEVYSRFKAKGKPCALITGEELRLPDDTDHYFRSCTVEMTPLNMVCDVAVIDEIQMIGDPERGWAWTQAFLGVQAKEVHLCGEERAVQLIQSLCRAIGDECVVHRYQRLSPLKPMRSNVKGFSQLQKGDCVVSFSRVAIHGLKQAIENATGKRCAIVYGSLPPETRAQQAALFNDPDNDYDFLVASDAIGMGLNLEIKRVVFEQVAKRVVGGFRQLSTSELRQIGGRAGRFRTASQAIKAGADGGASETTGSAPSVGLVTAMEEDDLDVIHRAFNSDPPPLMTAGMQPPPAVIERFATYFPPNTPFSYIISRLRDICRISPQYHLCSLKESLQIADLIQPYPMSVYDRCVLLAAPVFLREYNGPEVLQAYARCISDMQGGHLLDIPELDLGLLDIKEADFKVKAHEPNYLSRLEALHKSITLYLWLSYRYSGVFSAQHLAFHVKSLVEEKINGCLTKIDVTENARKARAAAIRTKAKAHQTRIEAVLGEVATSDVPESQGSGNWNEEGHEEPLYEDASELQQITRLEPDARRGNTQGGR